MKTMIKASDLIYLGNCAKGLKQSKIVYYDYKLIGTDNIENYVMYAQLSPEMISFSSTISFIFDYNQFAKFVRSITVESSFTYDDLERYNAFSTLTAIVELENSPMMINKVVSKLHNVSRINNIIGDAPEVDITEGLSDLFAMKKAEGRYNFIYDKNHYMTLFPGLLPVNKGDRVSVVIEDWFGSTFVARYTIYKKLYRLYIYIRYLMI